MLEIGRNDKGQVVGVTKATKLLEDLPNKVRDILGIIPEIDHIKKQNKNLILIKIKPYKHPINYKGNFYYRSGSTNQELRGPALHHFLLEKIGQTWDGVSVPKVSLSSLDSKVISEFKEKAVESKRLPVKIIKETNKTLIEKQLKLTEGKNLKRSAVLLFHPDPEMYVTGSYIKIGYFQTETEVRYHDEIHGDLFSQVEKTMELLLTKYLKAFISYKTGVSIKGIEWQIQELKKAGRLKRVGPAKGGYWEVIKKRHKESTNKCQLRSQKMKLKL